jgi:ferredoxin-NADP reductase
MTGSTLLLYISAVVVFQALLLSAVGLLKYRAAVQPGPTSISTTTRPAGAAWAGWRDFRVVRRVDEDELHSQCSFYMVPVDGMPLPAFKPGQFLTFQLMVRGQTLTRCYSLSDRPSADHYRVTIKRQNAPPDLPGVASGMASSHFHDAVQTDDILRVRAPSGAFFVDPDPSHDIVLIAGGIGITPMLSMLQWCVDEQPKRGVYLYYGLRCGLEQVFKTQLMQLAATHPNFHLTVAYSQPTSADEQDRDFQHLGYVDLELIKSTLPHGHHQFYICGPSPMMQSLVPALEAWGVAPADIHFEAFGPASVRSVASKGSDAQPISHSAAVQAHSVQFLQTGRTIEWTAASSNLLDFAEKNGVNIDSGCRAGSCGACQTKLLSGSVAYTDKPDYNISPGHCLLCVGVPSTDLVLAA